LERISIVSGKIWTSDWVAPLSISSAVTLPQSEEIRIRSCAIAGFDQSECDDEGSQGSIQQVKTSIFGFPPGTGLLDPVGQAPPPRRRLTIVFAWRTSVRRRPSLAPSELSNIRRDPPRLVASEQLGRRGPSRLFPK
jgi:hypothetical protein